MSDTYTYNDQVYDNARNHNARNHNPLPIKEKPLEGYTLEEEISILEDTYPRYLFIEGQRSCLYRVIELMIRKIKRDHC